MVRIEEIIVVEGRDDTAAIRRSVDAVTIETHGYGIRPQTWELIEQAYQTKGIIVFTDPDSAGERIRRRIMERFPGAKEAFLDRARAEKDGDIGIENASAEDIRAALEKAHTTISGVSGSGGGADQSDRADSFTAWDMFRWGIDGTDGAALRRRLLGDRLGIGQATSRTFLRRLNRFGIERARIEEALDEIRRGEEG